MYDLSMAKIPEKTKPGWAIPTDVKEQFVDFCTHVGSIAQEDCAGALVLWQHMPPQLREWAKLLAKGAAAMDDEWWQGLEARINAALRPQSPQPPTPEGADPQTVRATLSALADLAQEIRDRSSKIEAQPEKKTPGRGKAGRRQPVSD
jgi:hypothetical protein